jgi:hypothetical protein
MNHATQKVGVCSLWNRGEEVSDNVAASAPRIVANDFPAMIFHPDDFERLRDERQKALARGVPFELELRSRRNDGQYRWFLVRYNPLRDEQENVLRWYASATDIDDRKQAEDRLQLLLDVTNQVVSNLQLRDLLLAISSSIRRVMQCDVVSVCLPDSEMKRLQTFVIDFPDCEGFIQEALIPIEGSLGGFVFRYPVPEERYAVAYSNSCKSSIGLASTLRTSTIIKNAGPKKVFPTFPHMAAILAKWSAFRRERIPEQLQRT